MAKRGKTKPAATSQPMVVHTPKVVPLSGKEAFQAGFTAADCPYTEDDDQFETWNADWDAAADVKSALEEESKEEVSVSLVGLEPDGDEGDAPDEAEPPKSVVKEEYRARYAEAGHPAHCGDELAVLLNNLCLTKKEGIDMPRFEHVCLANGVDLSKYNRTTKGWQGRLRMTGRNMLAGRVFAAGGIVKTVLEDGTGLEGTEAQYKLSAEWMASRRKAEPATPPTSASAEVVSINAEAAV